MSDSHPYPPDILSGIILKFMLSPENCADFCACGDVCENTDPTVNMQSSIVDNKTSEEHLLHVFL